MKKILVLHTGGTIAMSSSEGGTVNLQDANPLLSYSPAPKTNNQLIVENIFNLPSPHITLAHMLTIKERIERALTEGIHSVVITHGTDTLEETAYFLDLTIGDKLPIILTGAMRSSNETGSDGLYNYETALRVAGADNALHKGVMVVMNDEIHPARYVTKTHTTNVATFQTPTFGPIGLVNKETITFYQELAHHRTLNVQTINGLIPIVKAYAGMDASILSIFATTAIDGLVIEALGAGNLPPQTVCAIDHLLEAKIPIVLVSRCFNGMAEGVYDYPGGGKQLAQKGVLFCNALNSQKARIKLLVGLNAHLSAHELASFIKEDS